jgi:hypothetical protein
MRVFKSAIVLTAFVGLAACQQQQDTAPAADLAFLEDLQNELAMEQADTQKVVSPVELGTAAKAEAAEAPAAPKPAARRSTSTRRSSSSSSSSGGYDGPSAVYTPAPREVTVKHTKRDAAIGAVTGAAVGAVAGGSQRRVQGAVVGAVIGGVAGAVIGNNVDKSTRVEY